MKGRHTITESDLDEWLKRPHWQAFAFAKSSSSASYKVLEVDAASDDAVFRVTDHGTILFIGTDKAAAIEFYNAAP